MGSFKRRLDNFMDGEERDEFDIIFSLGEVNRSPVVSVEHKLGLESWCMKHCYAHAHTSILKARQAKQVQEPGPLLRWTQFCLLVAPEVSTFWNIRKQLLQCGSLSADTDLHLTRLVLSRKPKCMEVFQHRKWLFHHILSPSLPLPPPPTPPPSATDHHNGSGPHEEPSRRFLLGEMEICGWTADKHQNNYHAWNHRLWILQQLAERPHGLAEAFRDEYETCHRWVRTHISEHSGLHYLQHLLATLVTLAAEGALPTLADAVPSAACPKDLYLTELEFNCGLIEQYPGHEALFCHRRVLLQRLRDILLHSAAPQRTASPPPPALKRSCVETVNSEWSAALLGERDMVNRCLKSQSYQRTLGERHAHWLGNVLAV
ncbi:Protein prenyltransferase alpha subunit repeat-containing protein 1 [Chionoecetes opilio]|uniref:Protein prenyltransferase alpha subunit repeat-containing protein 1 n=1 Tax=Chionoecetes opilio TaxID=41210 RepID=A0A8J5D141_CHIOP|nr:Protein prenyltransferase alpha subunit repeat-containing protein 1 [Chionoecetes opilio]